MERQRRRAAVEVWLLNKLTALSPDPALFLEAVKAEAKREKDAAEVAAGGGVGGQATAAPKKDKKREATGAELAARSADLRRRKEEVRRVLSFLVQYCHGLRCLVASCL